MADASAEGRRCMDGIAALPEDVVLEVFSRVGSVKDLFMFAVTCRRWLRRFTDPAFLRGLCPGQGEEGHRARLLGFFFQQTRFVRCERMIKMRMTQHTSVSAPTFLPAPGSPLGPMDRALTSFVADDDGTFNYAEPLAARCGIVLMQLVPRTEPMTATSHLLLGLCNPITGERHVLPPLESYGIPRYLTSYAIITAADSDLDGKQQRPSSSGRFTFSQLLLTTQHKDDYKLYLYSYSAATCSWRAPTMCLDGRRFSLVGERSAVVHHGVAHWLCIDLVTSRAAPDDYLYKLSVEVRTARVSLTKLPVRAGGSPLLCVSRDSKLSVACVYPVHVRVWTQLGGEGGDDTPAPWLRTVIRIPMAVPYPNYSLLCQPCEKFDFNRGSMLVLYRSSGVFILDLEKKVMEKVMDCFLSLFSDKLTLNRTSVAYEMDLVEFFVLQLGGLCRESTG
ncbi:hypothetical protein E2562_023341 [Oryza meyeriana var. granulata]|nr:hypothetical protein E2562_023341 [Oryza meyeriana var. granulata]